MAMNMTEGKPYKVILKFANSPITDVTQITGKKLSDYYTVNDNENN